MDGVSTAPQEAHMTVGAESIRAYSRLSYTMWHALAEFIDNSTQSRENHGSLINDVLAHEGQPLIVEIVFDRINRIVSISDNSIGMTKDKLIEALKIAHPTRDSRGRSKYGMGMKTAAFWIGSHWQIVTCEWASGEEWTADIDLNHIDQNNSGGSLPIALSMTPVSKDAHYTKIVIKELNRYFQQRTEGTIKSYLGSMYQFDIAEKKMKLLFGDEEIKTADSYNLDTDPSGNQMRTAVDVKIRGKQITGWVGVLRQGSGGRKFGGFSLFQNKRQIQGFPNAWKPSAIFSGVDDEGANNLVL